MKVVIISSDQYPFFVQTVNSLVEKGIEVHVFCGIRIGSKGRPVRLKNKVIFHDELVNRLSSEKNKLEIFRFPFTVIKFKKLLKKNQP